MLNKALYETGSGGSIIIKDKDIENDSGVFTSIYLAMFSSVSPYWGNDVFEINIDSQTEKALTSNSLDAEGIENIKRAIETDLSNLSFADFTVTLSNEDDKRLDILINAQNNGLFQAVWDFTQDQLIEFKEI